MVRSALGDSAEAGRRLEADFMERVRDESQPMEVRLRYFLVVSCFVRQFQPPSVITEGLTGGRPRPERAIVVKLMGTGANERLFCVDVDWNCEALTDALKKVITRLSETPYFSEVHEGR
jgi:hypothetical protein